MKLVLFDVIDDGMVYNEWFHISKQISLSLGHGPFSHMFESFIHETEKEKNEEKNNSEETSKTDKWTVLMILPLLSPKFPSLFVLRHFTDPYLATR